MAGCKGMVAIDPRSSLDDYYILVRESMIKFKTDDWNLEICDYARPSKEDEFDRSDSLIH